MKIFLFFYTDPGSGMMLLQILFAFFASSLFYFRKFFYKFFGKNTTTTELPDVEESISEHSRNTQSEV